MPSKLCVVLGAAAVSLPLACSASSREQLTATGGSGASGGTTLTGDERAFVPESLVNTPVAGQVADGLRLIAFTLRQGTTGPALYAAVRNDRETPACEAGMTTYFLDEAGQVTTTATSVLESAQLYRTGDGQIIRCVAPGELAMAGTELPSQVVIDELGSLEHAFPAFTVDNIVAVEPLHVSDVRSVTTGVGNLYEGKLSNGLSVSASAPRVAIFPLNRVGRPLGMATASSANELPPGSSWSFETGTVDASGADYAAYPAATFTP
jgi:hypothetical protein